MTEKTLQPERRTRFSQAERNKLTWLWEAQEEKAASGFDREATVKMLLEWNEAHQTVFPPPAPVSLRVGAEEAWFWIQIYQLGKELDKEGLCGGALLKAWEKRVPLANAAIPADPGHHAAVLDAVACAVVRPRWIPVLVAFLSPVQIAEGIIDVVVQNPGKHFDRVCRDLLGLFGDLVLNSLKPEGRESFRAAMVKRFQSAPQPGSPGHLLALYFLCLVRGGSELSAYLEGWANRALPCPQRINLRVLAGLAGEEEFVRETRRLGMDVFQAADFYQSMEIWLAATEWRQLDVVVSHLRMVRSKHESTRLAEIVAMVEAPEVAAVMLQIQVQTKAGAVAAKWFANHPLLTALGLVPVASGRGKLAEAARAVLKNISSAVLDAAAGHFSGPVREWFDRELHQRSDSAEMVELAPVLGNAFKKLKPAPLPEWVQSAGLAPIQIDQARLGEADIALVLGALKKTPLSGEPNLLLEYLKEKADRQSLESFVWTLFEQWLAAGAPAKDKWAMGALGHLGGNACIFKLNPLIRKWPKENQHQRALFALEVFRAIGTDTALLAIQAIGQNPAFKGRKGKAEEILEAIAKSRGLSPDQLADRIVPDCELDASGTRIFDFGPRQFRFVLGADLKPLIRDAAGKVKSDLPAANAGDDPQKARLATEHWKVLKKTLHQAFKVQTERLQTALVTGRRWSHADFLELLVNHPLQSNLVRHLLFGAFSAEGVLQGAFRVTEDRTFANADDESFELPQGSSIGLLHPYYLDESSRGAWAQILSDYKIFSPFPQLGREILKPHAEDLELDSMNRFRDLGFDPQVLSSMLKGWRADHPHQFTRHCLYFYFANTTAVLEHGEFSLFDCVRLGPVFFVEGDVGPKCEGYDNKLRIKDVHPLVMSEVLRILRALEAVG